MRLITALLGLVLITSAAQAQAPATLGVWEPLQSLPFRPVHSVLLPDGQVMMFATQASGAVIWDPSTGALSPGPVFDYNPFCSGHVQTADGRVFFAGGQIGSLNSVGATDAAYYDPSTNAMSPVPHMNAGRWYPSLVAMGNGDVVVMSGSINVGIRNEIPEVWDAKTGAWRDLTEARLRLQRYPAAFLAPNGNVFVATSTSRYLDVEGSGSWSFVADRLDSGRDDYGSACLYDDGMVLYTGGGDAPLASGEVIDLNSASPAWSYIADMPEPRRQHNTTLLPDGRVLVTGGSSSAGFNTEDGPKTAIVWDPAANNWTTWARESEFRGYHSESLLLPDGRVVSIGGDGHPSLQVFSPPYLHNGPRPVVQSAPAAVRYGDTFTIETPDAADIAAGGQVTWLRPGSVTHTKNMNQRFGRLAFIEVSGDLEVTVPNDPNISPPGDYMVFLVNSNGIPSEAQWVRLATQVSVPGLIETWQFDLDGRSGSGSNTADLLNGAAIVTDPERGTVLSCDGTDDLARASNTLSSTFSWAAWVLTTDASSTGVFAWEGDSLIASEVAGAGNDFVLSILNNQLAFYAGETGESISGTTLLNDGQWHHVAVTADSNSVNLYVDGVLEATGTGLTATPNANNDLHFCGSPVSGNYFGGLLDEIAQYDRALTGPEVDQLATSGGGTDPLTIGEIVSPPVQVGVSASYQAFATGGANLQYRWNFGDGSAEVGPGSDSSVSHTFSTPGIYLASVVITSATGESAIENFWQAVYEPHTPNRPASSSSIIYEDRSTDDRVWNVNPDNDSVSVFDALFQRKLAEIAVGGSPRSLAVAPDGRVWVTNKKSATLSIINPSNLKVDATLQLPYQSQPHGIVFDPNGTAAFVALEATGQVLKLNPLDGSVVGAVDVGPDVRHLAIDSQGTSLFVSRFVTPPIPDEATAAPDILGVGGQVLVVDTQNMQLLNTVVLQNSDADDGAVQHNHDDENGHSEARGIPNYLGAAAISPDGLSAWVPSKQDNILRGVYRDGLHLTHDTTLRAVSSKIDLGNSPALAQEDYLSRVDHDNSAIPSAAVHGRFGNYLFVALEGSREVRVMDAYGGSEIAAIDVGRAPQGLAISPDGMTLYTHNFMDRTVSVHDVSSIINENRPEPVLIATNSAVANEALSPEVLRGKQLFYDADDERLSLESYISCAACHNDGGGDGRVWDFSGFGEGLRNTIDLRGKSGHGPLHWTGNFDEVQDFENQIRALAHGLGLLSESQFNMPGVADPLGTPKAGLNADLDALAAYVNSLNQTTPSPWRNADRTLSAAAEAGKQVFLGAGCGSCHSGFRFTDSQPGLLHPVASIKPSSGSNSGQPLVGLDTPTLKGLWNASPYLHDGSAQTIPDAIAAHVSPAPGAADLASIAAYLRELDDFETTLRYEAEAMSLSGFRRESVSTSSAGEVINLKGSANAGTATVAFIGATGNYDVVVGYHDESDGIGQIDVSIGGALLDSWLLDSSPGGSQPGPLNALTRQVASSYPMANGDAIEFAAVQGNWDNANIDFIEFRPTEVVNSAPTITTTAVTSAEVAELYEYDVDASDADTTDVLTFSLDVAPAGMSIDAMTGVISWSPAAGQEGDNAVTVRVEDNGVPVKADTQSFTIDVLAEGANQPPRIDSTPPLSATVDLLYEYDVNASDPDASDTLTYSLDQAPPGMAIDPVSGLIGWTPTSAQEGDNLVTVRVEDNGDPVEVATQSFSITVVPSAPVGFERLEAESMNLSGFRRESVATSSAGEVVNLKGKATSGTATTTFGGATGAYDIVVGYHDESDGIAEIAVTIDGIVIDNWILDASPGGAQPEAGNALVRQVASSYIVASGDTIQLSAIQGNWDNANIDYIEFRPAGLVNLPPRITSAPVLFVQVDELYEYDVEASDPDAGDVLSYSLDVAPPAMTIDPDTGLISWMPASGEEGEHAVTVRVQDNGSPMQSDTQSFSVTVTTDQPGAYLRMEAEGMNLSGFRNESVSTSSAGVVINLKGKATSGTATIPFGGATGNYDIVVGYYDENDGNAQISVTIGGALLDSWLLDSSPGGAQPTATNALTRQVASSYPVTNGEVIDISAVQGNWDNANIDYIEFIPAP